MDAIQQAKQQRDLYMHMLSPIMLQTTSTHFTGMKSTFHKIISSDRKAIEKALKKTLQSNGYDNHIFDIWKVVL